MLKALYYCHKIIKVIHRDIKPDNIMINHNNEAVLIDFGVSALVENQQDDELKNNMGSYMFFAPEMFERKTKSIKVRGERTDIWALGITLYYLLCGRYPFEEAKNPLHLKELITQHDINYSFIKRPAARELLERMLDKNPDRRATIDEIKESEWVLGKEKEVVKFDQIVDKKKDNFGNIQRLLKAQTMFGATEGNLFSKKKVEGKSDLLGKPMLEQVDDDSSSESDSDSDSESTSRIETDPSMKNTSRIETDPSMEGVF